MPRGMCIDYRKVDIERKIKALMKSAKITQHDLADAWGISQGRVSQKIQTGDINLSELIEIIDMAKAQPEEITRLLKK